MNNSAYFKGDDFYYISISDPSISRDNKISDIFGESFESFYIGEKITKDISKARFWKDLISTKLYIRRDTKNIISADQIYGKSMIITCQATRTSYTINKINREEFIKVIPESYDINDFVTKRNLNLKKKEIIHQNNWKSLRSKYKAISSYTKVPDPKNWLPCRNCGLIPLIWEFDNGRFTACGCGKNEYDHFSIKAESIVSYMKKNNGSMVGYNNLELRTNWNNWVLNKLN